MRYRPLGSTGLSVSEVGFGTWGLGGTSYGPVADQESRLALESAFARGVNFYDTSDLYGDGHSEEIVGQTFVGKRQQVLIATKVGMLPHQGFDMPQDFSIAHISRALRASLRRLRTDYVDLYLLHSPPADLPNWDEIVATLAQFQASGAIRAFGLSARSPDDARTAIERYRLGAVQVNFNLIDQRALESGLLALCAARSVGVVARTPLCFGFLTGTLTGDEEFSPGDHRANWPREQLRRWAQAPAVFRPLLRGPDHTLVQLALQWCLSDAAVSTVIPGMLTVAEVGQDTSVVDLPPLTIEEREAVRVAYRSHVFYDPESKQPRQVADGPSNMSQRKE
jgi:aryl-alcohol dehydrogenase-like predicted oxidoreductase